MNVQQMIEILSTIEDKTIPVVFRTKNHGADFVTIVSHWGAVDNPNSGKFIGASDMILPDNQYEGMDVLVIS